MAKKNNCDISLTDMEREFHKCYYTEVAPLLEKWESKRKIELIKFLSVAVLMIAIIAGAIYLVIEKPYLNLDDLLFFVALGSFIGGIILLWHIWSHFISTLKKECMPHVVRAFSSMNWYHKNETHTADELISSELFSAFNRRNDDDSFSGIYKDVKYAISELSLWNESGSGRNRIIYSVFNGVIVSFDSNKVIKNKTMIATKNDIHIKGRNWALIIALLYCIPTFFQLLLPIISPNPTDTPEDTGFSLFWVLVVIIILICTHCIGKNKNKKEVLNEIKLEDPEFCRRYRAFSSDEVEGRYLITPAFMQRFKNLQTAFGSTKAKCAFFGKDVMFAITTKKNLFEIGNLFTPLNNPKHMKVFFSEIRSILALIDYFKFDEKTGI